MKKRILLLSLIMCCGLCGCGKKDNTAEQEETSAQEQQEEDTEEETQTVEEETDPNAVTFKGAEGVTVVCPEGYEAKADKNNVIEFVPEDGSDDAYLSITAEIFKTDEYDAYMSKGQYYAETYMKKLLCDKIIELYGDDMLYFTGCNFTDGDTYWDISGIVTLDGSKCKPACEEDPEVQVNFRYSGPDNYILMTSVTALDEDMSEYALAADEIHDSVKMGSDWNTCPKDCPKAEDIPDGTDKISTDRSSRKLSLIKAASDGTETADITDVFFWMDADEDVWFFNGVSNEFVGYGTDVDIEDGEVYSYDGREWAYNSPYEFDYYDYYDAWDILGYEAYFDNFEGYYEYYDGTVTDEEDEDWSEDDEDWDEDDEDWDEDDEDWDEDDEDWDEDDEDWDEDDEDWDEDDEDWEDDSDDSEDDEDWEDDSDDDEDWEDDTEDWSDDTEE